MATKKKNIIEHRHRKNMGSAEFFRKQRKERNTARPKQRWVEDELPAGYASVPEYVPAPPGHWERP